MSTLASFIQHSFGSPSYGNQRRKNCIQAEKEVKLPLFADDILYIEIYVFTIHKFADLLYIENPKNVTRKLLQLINEFGKFVGSEISTQKYLGFLYTKNKRSEREIKETIPFTIALKRIKYLGINIPKEVKELHS